MTITCMHDSNKLIYFIFQQTIIAQWYSVRLLCLRSRVQVLPKTVFWTCYFQIFRKKKKAQRGLEPSTFSLAIWHLTIELLRSDGNGSLVWSVCKFGLWFVLLAASSYLLCAVPCVCCVHNTFARDAKKYWIKFQIPSFGNRQGLSFRSTI